MPAFHPSFLGLYGDEETTARTVREFKGYVHAHAPNEHIRIRDFVKGAKHFAATMARL